MMVEEEEEEEMEGWEENSEMGEEIPRRCQRADRRGDDLRCQRLILKSANRYVEIESSRR
ncbi:MAG: hypothetical protein WBK88_06260 [Methanothrix sp.]